MKEGVSPDQEQSVGGGAEPEDEQDDWQEAEMPSQVVAASGGEGGGPRNQAVESQEGARDHASRQHGNPGGARGERPSITARKCVRGQHGKHGCQERGCADRQRRRTRQPSRQEAGDSASSFHETELERTDRETRSAQQDEPGSLDR
jgi:hypothetical protein